ncbi:MAG: PilZ domain-containing protein [Methylococcaceae bacterium]|nr:PilZ domain-containing protein [Methylococcaceae bacterium]
MMDFAEKREYFRMRINCDIHCKREGESDICVARCTSLSGAGVSFMTTQALNLGEKLEVTIHPENSITPSMSGIITIVRVIALENKEFEIGATMQVLAD